MPVSFFRRQLHEHEGDASGSLGRYCLHKSYLLTGVQHFTPFQNLSSFGEEINDIFLPLTP